MGTRIDISVAQQQLSRRVRELAQQNRAQRVRREDQAKEDAELREAVNQGLAQASRRGRQRPGGNAADFGLDAAAESDRLGALGLRSGVPEYYTGPKVAAQLPVAGWVLGPVSAELKTRTRRIQPFSFIFNTANPGDPIDPADGLFRPGGGPVAGTGAFSVPSGGGSGAIQAYGVGVTQEPAGHSYTYEFMAKLFDNLPSLPAEGDDGYIAAGAQLYTGNFLARLLLSGAYDSGWTVTVELTAGPVGTPFFVAASRPIDDYALVVPELQSGGYFHYAVVVRRGASDSRRVLSAYVNGIRCFQENQEWPTESLFWQDFNLANLFSQWRNGSGGISALHGFRFTSRALYAGESFSPPSSITRLA